MNYVVGEDVNVNGTHLQGYIEASYDRLVELFGEPTYTCDSLCEKVNVEWNIEFGTGTVATIYNWKDFDGGFLCTQENSWKWHVGGFNKFAQWQIEEVLNNANS